MRDSPARIRRWGLASVLSIGLLATTAPGRGSLRREPGGGPSPPAWLGHPERHDPGHPPQAGRAHLRDPPAGTRAPPFRSTRCLFHRQPATAATWCCFPHYGPASAEEREQGLRGHGEAGSVEWRETRPAVVTADAVTFFYGAELPKTQYAHRARGDGARWRAVGPGRGIGRESSRSTTGPTTGTSTRPSVRRSWRPSANVLDVSGSAALTDPRRTGGGQWSPAAEFRWPDAPRAEGGSDQPAPVSRPPGRAGLHARPDGGTATRSAGSRSTTSNHRLLVGYLFPASRSPVDRRLAESAGRRQPGPDGARDRVRHVAVRRGTAQERRARAAVRHADLPMDRRPAAALDHVPDLPDRGAAGLRRRRGRARDGRTHHPARTRDGPRAHRSRRLDTLTYRALASRPTRKPSLKSTHNPNSLGATRSSRRSPFRSTTLY